jgi:hypothetical protein
VIKRADVDPNYELNDREAVLAALRQAGSNGVHSLDLRAGGYSGNPSERIRDLLKLGYSIRIQRERRGKRNGARYTLVEVGVVSRGAASPSDGRDSVDLGELRRDDPGSLTSPGPREKAPSTPGVGGPQREFRAGSADGGSNVPAPGTPHEASRIDGGLFDADAFKPKRQHDKIEEAA